MIGNGRHLSGRQKLDAMDQQQELFRAAGDRCVVCGGYGPLQLGHRLGQGKRMMTKYGPEVIHSPLAMVPTCSLRCNAAVLIGDETEPGKSLVARIRRILDGEEPRPDMRHEYGLLREEFIDKLGLKF